MFGELVPDGGALDDVALLTLRTIPMSDRFRVELPTEPEALASMRSLLRRWLRHVSGSEQEIAEVVTACGEAATNAIEHAGVGRHSRSAARSTAASGDRRARPRCLACPPGRRPWQGTVVDAGSDGYR